jgi:hypothetical protein
VYRLEHAYWLQRELVQPTVPAAPVPNADGVSAVAAAAAGGRKRKRNEPAVPKEPKKKKTKPDSRTRASTTDELEARVATAVYALGNSHIRSSWRHTLNGKALLAAAEAGHAQREKSGKQVAIPLSKKRKTQAAAAEALHTQAQAASADEEAQRREEADAAAAAVEGDDLQVVLTDE